MAGSTLVWLLAWLAVEAVADEVESHRRAESELAKARAKLLRALRDRADREMCHRGPYR
jgi:hypothetical protein